MTYDEMFVSPPELIDGVDYLVCAKCGALVPVASPPNYPGDDGPPVVHYNWHKEGR